MSKDATPSVSESRKPSLAAGGVQKLRVDPDGTIHVTAFELPLSAALSPEARQAQIAALTRPAVNMPSLDGIKSEAEFIAYVDKFRQDIDSKFIKPLSQALAGAFPVDIRATKIAGVPVEEFTPETRGVERRILINLHGGAFFSGAVFVGRVESIPVTSLGKIKVISVDYRQGYEHKYPAASEDVVTVYRELLKEYPPENIGIYGGSAGGGLTAQATAWILSKGLPAPGAIGIFGSGGNGGDGDATYFSKIGTASTPSALSEAGGPLGLMRPGAFGYFSTVSPEDYLAAPVSAPKDLLSKFPPTLLISATRALDMSPAIAFHRALTRAGADASLHLFDGLGHCFYYNAWLPESRDAYDRIIRFFDRHLRQSPAPS